MVLILNTPTTGRSSKSDSWHFGPVGLEVGGPEGLSEGLGKRKAVAHEPQRTVGGVRAFGGFWVFLR